MAFIAFARDHDFIAFPEINKNWNPNLWSTHFSFLEVRDFISTRLRTLERCSAVEFNVLCGSTFSSTLQFAFHYLVCPASDCFLSSDIVTPSTQLSESFSLFETWLTTDGFPSSRTGQSGRSWERKRSTWPDKCCRWRFQLKTNHLSLSLFHCPQSHWRSCCLWMTTTLQRHSNWFEFQYHWLFF